MWDFVDREQAGLDHRSGKRRLSFGECFQRANNFEVAEPRDMLYALLGLTDGRLRRADLLTPDYEEPLP